MVKSCLPANSTAQYALEQALALNKIDKSKIKLIPLKPAEIVSAWTRGDIDAAYVWGPFTQQLEKEGGKEIYRTTTLNEKVFWFITTSLSVKSLQKNTLTLLLNF